MVSLTNQIREMEAALRRIGQAFPDMPVTAILTSRLLVHLGRELANQLDQRLKPHGLSDIEFRALVNVYSFRDSAAYPGELCTTLAQSPANITRITDTLVERGLISRVPDERDRRRLVLKITEQGNQIVQTLLPLMFESVRASYQDFSPATLDLLLSSLKHLAQALDDAGDRASALVKETKS